MAKRIILYEEGDKVKLLSQDTESIKNLIKDGGNEAKRGYTKEAKMLQEDAACLKSMRVGRTYFVACDQPVDSEFVTLIVGKEEVLLRSTLVELVE